MRIWRNNTGKGLSLDGKRVITFGLKGSPDIIGVLRGGRFVGIEVKKPGGRQSDRQKKFQKMLEAFGGLYILADHPDDVGQALEEAGL